MSVASTTELSDLINTSLSPFKPQTSVELLRFRHTPPGSLIRELCETLGDEVVDSIAGESKRRSNNHGIPDAESDAQFLQFVFLHSLRNKRGCTTNQVGITQNTLLALCIKLGVTLHFLDGVLNPSIWSKQSGGCFHTYDNEGRVESISGFYHYFNEWHLGPLHTWFSYNVETKCTTYLLLDCPHKVKERLWAGDFVPQPLVVDLLLAEECALWRECLINKHYQQIFNWHENNGTMDPPLNRHINTIHSMRTLHQLSRTWNMIYEDLGDLEERLDFLISTSEKLTAVGIQTRATAEHLEFLKARNQLRRRWVTSFGERTKLIINFVFSLANQEIARQVQKENSSMMTIATVTMLFLPGAFVASVLQVSNKLWQFFAITIPATILVLVVYQVWRRTREGRLLSKSSDAVGESLAKNIPVGGA